MKETLRRLLLILLAAALASLTAFAAEEPPADPMAERLAAAQQEIRVKKAGKYGMVPIYGRDVADGVYDVTVESSSSFFRVTQAQLTVTEGEMTLRFTIPSMSYLFVYPGTARQAGDAPEGERIGYEEVDKHTVFTFPVAALNSPLDCAAYSKARRRWYNRKLVVDAASLPAGALSFPLPDYELIEDAVAAYEVTGSAEALQKRLEGRADGEEPEAVAMDLPDGEYSVEVNMTGGSGRASISSPTLLTVRDGRGYARLLWSSSYYDYLILDGALYLNETQDGGPSSFEIPVTALDEPIPIVADTTAMGDPVEIAYTLTFYAESVGAKGQVPQEAAKRVLILAGAIILLGGALDRFIKKRKRS